MHVEGLGVVSGHHWLFVGVQVGGFFRFTPSFLFSVLMFFLLLEDVFWDYIKKMRLKVWVEKE